MKAHLLRFLILDHDDVGAADATQLIEDAHYPNHAIAPYSVGAQTAEIGEWSDDHPLNHDDTAIAEIARLFGPTLDERDVRIETVRDEEVANVTSRVCRAVHVPTGLEVVVGAHKSFHKNRAAALVALAAAVAALVALEA